MKKRHTEEQILGILKEDEQGKPVADVLRERWHRRPDLLPLEEQIQWLGTEPVAATARTPQSPLTTRQNSH